MEERKNALENRVSKKYDKILPVLDVFIYCIYCCAVTFLVFLVVMVLHGYSLFFWLCRIFFLGFFCSLGVGLTLSNRFGREITEYAVYCMKRKYSEKELTVLENLTKENIREKFLSLNFKELDNGCLRRFYRNRLDKYCFYSACMSGDEFRHTFRKAALYFNGVRETANSTVLLLFFYKENIDQTDLDNLHEAGERCVMNEELLSLYIDHVTFPILVDPATNRGYFLDINEKRSRSSYAYGCSILNQLFKQ